MIKKFMKVLVANRGEIAIRIFRACYDLGLRTVGIYSKEDKYSLFRTRADESYLVGEYDSPLGAYLNIKQIITLAKEKGVDAIHPGYGFLSENPALAKACEDAGIAFIGPPSDVLAKMGDKLNAKAIADRAGVKTIPGSVLPLKDVEEAVKLANEIGYPVILKASAGGGGRGMRLARNIDALKTNFALTKSEALKAFGSEDIFLEKYLEEPKHIEVQVLGDNYGNIVHLFERDCSVQRRYQKVIEYTPAFSIPKEKREQLYQDALKIAKDVGYVNAGTVEFLVDKSGNHYFIEMNPRIQVEHTVTEATTGVDLVQAQILIAQGYSLDSPQINLTQSNISQYGYAIQCRVTTEDPQNNFAPDTGRIAEYRSGGGNGVRLDAGNAFTGAEILPYYDSLLVKITTFDRTFDGTIRKAIRSLNEIRVRGVKTNVAFLLNVLQHPVFKAGACHTRFIDSTPELFDFALREDKASKVLKYVGEKAVNSNRPLKTIKALPRIPKGYDSEPPAGFKQMLDKYGPEYVRDYVLKEKKLLISDTTLRDAHQSLYATRLRTRDMLNIAKATSHILHNAFSLEMWGGATFDTAYRFLRESPWKRLEELRKRIPNILFQMLFRGANAVGYTNYSDNVIKEFIRLAAESGIDVFRIFDSLNWLPGMQLAIEETIKHNKIAEATICYTGNILDPKRDKYSLEYYVKLAKELEKTGAHFLCIKDMSGLLRPLAARKLIKALKDEISIPIVLHTHDTSGNQIAALMLACEAGVDIVDCAIESMSTFTSQPSLNSLAYALQSHERDPQMDLEGLHKLSEYWEDIRPLYKKFYAGLEHPETEIYKLEIPGGQYSNLRPQVESVGLGDRFDEVKEMYVTVNEILGDIVKVTPSSKVVGDLAIFMVQNDLNKDNIVEKASQLAFPDSVVSYFKGMMGQPEGGFPVELQKAVLKGEEPISCRPGELLPPVNFETVRKSLPKGFNDDKSVISACLYDKVFDEYIKFRNEYGDLSRMETSVFFDGMDPGESTELEIEDGKMLAVKYIGLGDANEDGTRTIIFELNGAQRTVHVNDKTVEKKASSTVLADLDNKYEVGANLPGIVSKILVKKGDRVIENQPLAVIEAMKMETNIVARTAGKVKQIRVSVGQDVKGGELLMTLEEI